MPGSSQTQHVLSAGTTSSLAPLLRLPLLFLCMNLIMRVPETDSQIRLTDLDDVESKSGDISGENDESKQENSERFVIV